MRGDRPQASSTSSGRRRDGAANDATPVDWRPALPAAAAGVAQVRDWAARVGSSDPKGPVEAEAALVRGGARSVPVLRQLLADEELLLRTFEIIRRIGPPAMPLLVELLRDIRVPIRRNAVDSLIDLAPYTETIQPALRRALRDEDAEVAGDAARALGALGSKAAPSTGALVQALSHADPHVRIYAAESLASIGPMAASATPDLARAVGDSIPGVRWAACEALASIGPAAHAAVPHLTEALSDESPTCASSRPARWAASAREHARHGRR